MDPITLRLSGPTINEAEIKQSVQVSKGENYYSALSKSLAQAQENFNSLLTELVDKEKKRSEGSSNEKNAKKLKT